MTIEEMIRQNTKHKRKARKILLEQLKNWEKAKTFTLPKHKYKVGDYVYLNKGTFLHGTSLKKDVLPVISSEGLLSSEVISKTANQKKYIQKYPFCVCVWNLQKDMFLKDYIDLYCGITMEYSDGKNIKTELISYSRLKEGFDFIPKNTFSWKAEQTKEIRFMPSKTNLEIGKSRQLAFIINTDNDAIKPILEYDIFSSKYDKSFLKNFVLPNVLNYFMHGKRNDFFTNRESAIILGIPNNFIEGMLVGKELEKDKSKLKELKEMFPNCYIANLNGQVIKR